MQTLLTALTQAVTSITTMFTSFFSGLSEAFLNTTGTTPELTFVGGVLVIGIVVMFGFMILRWIISLVRGI